ncbi:MAG: hypothetical protein C0601_03550 [Candidatus Muiribacterium halophilum]|uniref:Uncharacterized protein n=1 Tax=Muiribacterium halophilum TaxID=2053465 RepID=A0A2N5ZJK3_MUIH1|nr:MAG: hypothetical protein C0601_03550 [Candidatus Muirbacterium halophilum]
MTGNLLKQMFIVVVISFLIIPVLTFKNIITTRADYKTIKEFTASYLLFDLMEKSTHGHEIGISDDIRWNSKYFADFEGKANIVKTENNINYYELEILWPKSRGNTIEKASFKINTSWYNHIEHKGVLHEQTW